MSYETAITIKEVISQIHNKRYLLPSIQREFIWNTEQIEKLFDSLMRDYPISSFLFWGVNREKKTNFQFYEFLREYHEKKQRHNPKANISGEESIIAVLDGQQRLTSLYVGLKGSYAYKMPRKRWENDQAYPKRKLFLNLVSRSEDSDLEFDFSFLTEEESMEKSLTVFWFEVGKVLEMEEPSHVNRFLIDNDIFQKYEKAQANFANNTLSKLHSIVHIKPTISYYLEKGDELEKVLNIFIRINSGGTELSHSDLLLSIATAQWENLDAREEITNFVEEINGIGDGFRFNKDFVLKSSLVLSDFNDIAFKVDNFNKANMLHIEKNWENITKAIRLSINLVSGFGYSGETLTSNNALIPIAYYLLKIGLPENFEKSSHTIGERQKVFKWLASSLVKQAFSGQPDTVIRPIKNIISQISDTAFPFEAIKKEFAGSNKTLNFNQENIDNLLFYEYGQSYTFSALAFLYPQFDFRNRFHIDHIFPRSEFSHQKLRKRGITEDNIPAFMENVNRLGNLQLLEDIPNMEKQATEYETWLNRTYSSAAEREENRRRHYIPSVSLDFANFLEFFEERQKLLRRRFSDTLL